MPTTSVEPNTTLRRLLLAAPEHRPVWERLGVNPARDGNRTLATLCRSRGLESRTVARILAALREARPPDPTACVELMTLAQLCDHLENTHHNLHDELKRLDRVTKSLVKPSAAGNSKLLAIRRSFVAFQRRFKAHLRKESRQLFPAVRRWAASRNGTWRSLPLSKSPLAQLEWEHSQADEALAELRSLVAGIAPAASAQAAVQTVADLLAHLEHAVQEQIYKENHILFPRALPMRRRLRAEKRGLARSVSVPVQRTQRRNPVQPNQTKEEYHEPNRRRLP